MVFNQKVGAAVVAVISVRRRPDREARVAALKRDLLGRRFGCRRFNARARPAEDD
jgi:hypothetical protein